MWSCDVDRQTDLPIGGVAGVDKQHFRGPARITFGDRYGHFPSWARRAAASSRSTLRPAIAYSGPPLPHNPRISRS